MKALFLTCTIALAAGMLLAQKPKTAPKETNDPKATSILKELRKQYDGYKTLEAQFTLQISIPNQKPETQQGKMIQQGEKYYLETKDQQVYSDGKSLWLYQRKRNEVQVNDAKTEAELDILSPKDLLRIYEKPNFIYALVNEYTNNKVSYQQIEFKPTDRNSEYTKVRLTLTKKPRQVYQLEVFSRDGSKYTLTLNKLVPNPKVDATQFTFNKAKFPGVKMEDLRVD